MLGYFPNSTKVCHFGPDADAPLNDKNNWGDSPHAEIVIDNGRKYYIQTPAASVPIIHVWGEPYQMGYAHGKLMRHEILEFAPIFIEYISELFLAIVTTHMPGLPHVVREKLAADLKNDTITEIMANTERYTDQRFEEELTGIHHATGIDIQTLR